MELHGFSQKNDLQTVQTAVFSFPMFFHFSIDCYCGVQALGFLLQDAAEAAGSPQATILVQKIDEKMKQTDA